VALLLAALGLYGVVSLAVQQRTREIGIRIAVGGRPHAVARMFLASGVKVGAVGLAFGLPLSMAALKFAKLQGVIADAPGVNVGVIGGVIALLLLGVAAAAAWLPARRAAQINPASTLRVD
jgi:ABC-type antimicrobial peptide transport system permease subunit